MIILFFTSSVICQKEGWILPEVTSSFSAHFLFPAWPSHSMSLKAETGPEEGIPHRWSDKRLAGSKRTATQTEPLSEQQPHWKLYYKCDALITRVKHLSLLFVVRRDAKGQQITWNEAESCLNFLSYLWPAVIFTVCLYSQFSDACLK